MAFDRIDEKISAASDTSDVISGQSLLQPGSRAQNSLITAQIIPDSAADFEVQLEAAVNSRARVEFDAIGEWDQNEDTLITIFPISVNCLYRFKHISGAPCQVRMVG